jgi:cytoskeletal protein RodZ
VEDNSEEEKFKRSVELKKARVEYLLKILGVAYVTSFSLGAMLMFFYFLRQNFNPGGISASDTVSMVLISFGFFP